MLRASLTRIWRFIDDRSGASAFIAPMAKHLVPRDARWWYVLGSATLLAFLVQVISGVSLALAYIPSSSQAYETLQFISHQASGGAFLRGLHYYGASAMVLLVGLHMARVFLSGAYKFPREMNWMTGVLLLGFTLLMGFSGQLLRWDQNAVWSVLVASEQAGRLPLLGDSVAHFLLGGGTIGGATLSRFFVFHVFIVPTLIATFVALHLALVLKNGISEPPAAGKPVDPRTYRKDYEALLDRDGVPFWPHAVWRDVVFSTVVLLAIVLLAAFVGAPELGKPPDPSITQANPRPDWYLLWYFAVLALLPHWIEDYFMILAPACAGLVLFALPLLSNKGERSPRRRPWAIGIVVLVVSGIGTFWKLGVASPWSPNFEARPLTAQVVAATSAPVARGAEVFSTRGCLYCHLIDGHGGQRGPDLSTIGDELPADQLALRIANGGVNMPAYAEILTTQEMSDLVAFLESRGRQGQHLETASK